MSTMVHVVICPFEDRRENRHLSGWAVHPYDSDKDCIEGGNFMAAVVSGQNGEWTVRKAEYGWNSNLKSVSEPIVRVGSEKEAGSAAYSIASNQLARELIRDKF